MAAHRRQLQDTAGFRQRILVQALEWNELGLFRWRVPDALGRRQGQPEAAGDADPRVVIFEVRKHRLDAVADQIVIIYQSLPWHLAGRQGRHRNAGDNRRFGTQIFRGRGQLAA